MDEQNGEGRLCSAAFVSDGVAVVEQMLCLVRKNDSVVGMRGGVLLACAEEGFEDGLLTLVIVVHDVDKHKLVHEIMDEGAARALRLIDQRPLAPELIRLVLEPNISIETLYQSMLSLLSKP